MARARLFRPVTDEHGDLLYGATVTVRTADASGLISQALFEKSFGTEALENPFVIASGYVSLWLDTPERVNLLIEAQGREAISIVLDVHAPASEVVRTASPLKVTNAPAAGKTLVATSGTEAAWQTVSAPPGPVAPHNHEGGGTHSVALGDGATASSDSSTAVGDGATASAANASAYGQGSLAGAANATAFGQGSSAQGLSSTAVGRQSAASGDYAAALGAEAVASGTQSSAVGHAAQAVGDSALAVGDSASATGDGTTAIGANANAGAANATALGAGADASHQGSTAIGAGAATTAEDQIALGTADDTVLVVGALRALSDTALGSPTSVLGFFGSAGVTIQTVTGDDGGDLVLRSVIEALADMGLIVDATTKG